MLVSVTLELERISDMPLHPILSKIDWIPFLRDSCKVREICDMSPTVQNPPETLCPLANRKLRLARSLTMIFCASWHFSSNFSAAPSVVCRVHRRMSKSRVPQERPSNHNSAAPQTGLTCSLVSRSLRICLCWSTSSPLSCEYFTC
jgi:hypothetical protein